MVSVLLLLAHEDAHPRVSYVKIKNKTRRLLFSLSEHSQRSRSKSFWASCSTSAIVLELRNVFCCQYFAKAPSLATAKNDSTRTNSTRTLKTSSTKNLRRRGAAPQGILGLEALSVRQRYSKTGGKTLDHFFTVFRKQRVPPTVYCEQPKRDFGKFSSHHDRSRI